MKTRNIAVAALIGALAAGAWAAGDKPSPRAPTTDHVLHGYRGIAVPLGGDQLTFIKKGDRVDVLVTFEANLKDDKEKMTATILQNIIVLDIRRPSKLTDMGAVELLVNPNEGQYMALALNQGGVRLMLRAPGDTELHPMEMAAFRKLFK
ncbi:MAG: hypothetical protein KGL53_16075 [Elusimicrobia bacterium]|nr:hypothetical protein [Elusimicrobiota bacterium]